MSEDDFDYEVQEFELEHKIEVEREDGMPFKRSFEVLKKTASLFERGSSIKRVRLSNYFAKQKHFIVLDVTASDTEIDEFISSGRSPAQKRKSNYVHELEKNLRDVLIERGSGDGWASVSAPWGSELSEAQLDRAAEILIQLIQHFERAGGEFAVEVLAVSTPQVTTSLGPTKFVIPLGISDSDLAYMLKHEKVPGDVAER